MKERKTVFVTGAASGFGKETVEVFSGDAEFDPIIATDKNSSVHDIFESYPNVVTETLDTRNYSDITSVVSWASNKFSGIDILVNNAGIQNSGTPDSYLDAQGNPTPELAEMWETNLRGPILIMQEVLCRMQERHEGQIYNITSVSEHNRSPYRSPYSDFKSVLTGVTYRMADEYKNQGIRVVAVQPGMHKTTLDKPRKWTRDTNTEDAAAAQALYDWWRANIGSNPRNVAQTIYDIAQGNRQPESVRIELDDYVAEGERIFIGWDAHLTSYLDEHLPGWPTIFTTGYNLVYGSVKLAQQIGRRSYWVDQTGDRNY